jgi:hypothetical protein
MPTAVELVHLSNELGFSNELKRVSAAHLASASASAKPLPQICPRHTGYLQRGVCSLSRAKSREVCFLNCDHVPPSPHRRAPQLVEFAIRKPTWFSVPKTGTALAIIHAPSTSRAISCTRRLHHLAHSPAIGDVAANLREARFSGLQEGSADRVFRRCLKRPLDIRAKWRIVY